MNLSRLFRRRRLPASEAPPPPAPQPVPATITDEDQDKVRRLLALVNDRSQPNINALNEIARNIDILALNMKAMGYDLARKLSAALPSDEPTAARHVGLASKISTQNDIESDWFLHWCRELKIAPVYHRKMWEFAYLLQALYDSGNIRPGARGLGFGCGVEPIPSYLAARGVRITMTDLPPEDVRAAGWSTNNEYAPTLEHARADHLIDRETFERLVSRRYVDMNAIPDDLSGYDFCWSICALEHLGSIDAGLAFVENALKTLRPGGTAVHTLEFNVNGDGPTIDNWMTVLFQRKHIEAVAERLRERGHDVAVLDFAAGDKPLDQFIDLPPWHDGPKGSLSQWLGQSYHLKVAVDGFVVTCFGLIVTKAEGAASVWSAS